LIGKQFLNTVAHGEIDILQELLDILGESKAAYCVVGGLAVNAYVEPVVSLDLDMVLALQDMDRVCKSAKLKGLKVEEFPHSVNLTSNKSDLRIQLQTDERCQSFISRSVSKEVLGYTLNVAAVQDVLQGKIWAYLDETSRKSKRQKDLADIARLIEAYPEMQPKIPSTILGKLNAQ